ncbi:MAG: helix-turn-helix transcriptional regulator [Clostridia bacterium]|nr:helix-turn-helix transcriptional regulator [Clostridia bacterium]
MENVTVIIGDNIAALRKANNLTQQQLADKIGYSNKAVSRWEKGECLPSVEILSTICEFFGVEFEYLIHKHENPVKIKKATVNANKIAITLLACLTVFTIATIVFVYVKLVHKINYWQAFSWAVPVSSLVVYELARRWSWNKIIRMITATVFLWTILTAIFLTVIDIVNVWPLYLIGIPVQIIFVLLFIMSKGDKNSK